MLLRWLSMMALLCLVTACAPETQRAAHVSPELVHRYAPPGPPGDPWGPFIQDASAEFGVPESLVYAVIYAESRGCQWLNGHPMRALSGEIGLMQIPPSIYTLIARRIQVGPDPYMPRDNIRAGTYSLSVMIGQFGLPDGLAAYQFGPTELAAARKAGHLPPAETQAYERNVWTDYQDRLLKQRRGEHWKGPDRIVCTWPGH